MVGIVCDNIPMSLQLPKTTAKLKTSLSYPCEFTEGSHNLVKNKFIDIVQKWFKQVPSNPDYYIYCPVNIPQSVSVSISNTHSKICFYQREKRDLSMLIPVVAASTIC